jgi:cytochrome c oxidase assembly protein subunit 15
MHTNSLINLSPVLNVAFMGLVVALGPISWVWMQKTPILADYGTSLEEAIWSRESIRIQRLLMLSQITLFLTFDLLIFGAYTRLTDSGLGCPDWPGCYGYTTPNGASSMIEGAQLLMPTGPVTHFKAWIEMIHRYLATGVGVLILTTSLFAWFNKLEASIRWSSLALLVWVCVQGAFGAFTVTMKLFPAIVSMHLMGAITLLMMLVFFISAQRGLIKVRSELKNGRTLTDVNSRISSPLNQNSTAHAERIDQMTNLLGDLAPLSSRTSTKFIAKLFGFAVVLVLCQILLGGWVSTNYAVTACSTFPMCQNSWWPDMDFAHGFEIWRPLGLTSSGENLSFSALTAIHYAHRLFAYFVIAFIGWLGWRLSREDKFKNFGYMIWGVIALQVITGISNAIFQWPLLSAVMHTGGAASLVIILFTGFLMARESTQLIKSNQTIESLEVNDSVQHSRASL